MGEIKSYIAVARERLRSSLVWALPWIALGPFTGPLGLGMARNMRIGNRALACLYGLAIVTTSFALALMA